MAERSARGGRTQFRLRKHAPSRKAQAMLGIAVSILAAAGLWTNALADWGAPAAPAVAPQAKSAPVPVAATITIQDIGVLQKAVTDAMEKMPLTVRRAIFVTEKVQMIGAWSERPSGVFKSGEPLLTYVEPVGYTWKPRGEQFDFGVSVDFILKSAAGKILGRQEKFSNATLSGHTKVQEFMLNLSLSLDGISPGQYVIEYKLHDLGSEKTATFAQPFTIAE
jgi:hypothetical protein